jgi:hypothetical protein
MSDARLSDLADDPASGPAATLTWQAEERGWETFMDLLERAPADAIAKPGYYREGWSIKDVVAHIGTWLAEAGVAIERIRNGSYVASEIDIDALNAQFLAAMRDVPFDIVRLQAWSARTMLRRQYFSLPSDPPAVATWWVRKSGPEHYEQHLPRLREWVDELTASKR